MQLHPEGEASARGEGQVGVPALPAARELERDRDDAAAPAAALPFLDHEHAETTRHVRLEGPEEDAAALREEQARRPEGSDPPLEGGERRARRRGRRLEELARAEPPPRGRPLDHDRAQLDALRRLRAHAGREVLGEGRGPERSGEERGGGAAEGRSHGLSSEGRGRAPGEGSRGARGGRPRPRATP